MAIATSRLLTGKLGPLYQHERGGAEMTTAARSTKDGRRLEALLDAKAAGIIESARPLSKTRFRVVISESDTVDLTGVQVDAFLFGVRLGQIHADKRFVRIN